MPRVPLKLIATLALCVCAISHAGTARLEFPAASVSFKHYWRIYYLTPDWEICHAYPADIPASVVWYVAPLDNGREPLNILSTGPRRVPQPKPISQGGLAAMIDEVCEAGIPGLSLKEVGNLWKESLLELARANHLRWLELPDSADDDVLAALQNFDNCWHLDISQTNVTAAGIPGLKNFPNLCSLGLPPKHRAAELRALAAVVPKLEALALNGHATLEIVPILKDFPHLKRLSVSFLDGKGVAAIQECLPNLEELEVRNCGFSDEQIPGFAGMKKLASISFDFGRNGGSRLTNTAMDTFAAMPALQSLELRGCSITGAGLEQMVSSKLRRLILSGAPLSGDHLNALARVPSLTSLGLMDCVGLYDDSIAPLAGMKQLRELILNKCANLTDGSLAHLRGLDELARLETFGTKVSRFGLASLNHIAGISSRVPSRQRLVSFWDGEHVISHPGFKEVTDSTIPLLANLPLTYADLWDNESITEAGLRQLKLIPSLTKVRLSPKHGDSALAALAECKNVTRIDATVHNISDDGLKALENAVWLTDLRFGGNKKITDAGIRHLANLKELSRIDLWGCGISLKSLEVLAGCPKLAELNLPDGLLNEDGFTLLKTFPGLTGLRFSTRSCAPIIPRLAPFGGLKTLVVSAPDFGDAEARLIASFPLKVLHVKGSQKLTDDGLAAICGIATLEELDLDQVSGITEKGLASLRNLPALRILGIPEKMTIAAAEMIAELPLEKVSNFSGNSPVNNILTQINNRSQRRVSQPQTAPGQPVKPPRPPGGEF